MTPTLCRRRPPALDPQGRPLRRFLPRDGGAVILWMAAGCGIWLLLGALLWVALR